MLFIGRLVMLSFVMTVFTATAQNIEKYQWKNRIILLKENTIDSDRLTGQLQRLEADSKALAERDILIFIITGGSVYDTSKKRLDLNYESIVEKHGLNDFQGLILIGKDGSLKLKECFIVDAKTIFELIDAMPMRMAETKNN
ncbi:MAG: DUF4174 domain-containing protein [Flavobacteriaceae bacterium]